MEKPQFPGIFACQWWSLDIYANFGAAITLYSRMQYSTCIARKQAMFSYSLASGRQRKRVGGFFRTCGGVVKTLAMGKRRMPGWQSEAGGIFPARGFTTSAVTSAKKASNPLTRFSPL